MKPLRVQQRLSLALGSFCSRKTISSWSYSLLPSWQYNTTPSVNFPVAMSCSVLNLSRTSLLSRSMRMSSEQVMIRMSTTESPSSFWSRQAPTSSTQEYSHQFSRMLQASSSQGRQGRISLNRWQRGRVISYSRYHLRQSRKVTDEFTPQMVLEAAKMIPVSGLVTRPVSPASIPFSTPTPPSYLCPWMGCSTTPTKPLLRLCPNSLRPIFKPMPKLSALIFLLSIRCFLNYRSKVSQLTPLPMVPMILLRLLLVPATMERKNGPAPPLFLPASNQETNWAGFPKILSPDATPTKLSMPYILLIPLMCFCLKGVVISTGERWMSASSTYTKLSPTLERSLLFCYVIYEMRFRMQSLIQMGLTAMELMWQVCSYCRLASSPLAPGGSSCYRAYACAMSETMNQSVRVISTSGPRSTATRSTNSPCTPQRYPESDWRSRKETRLYMPFSDYSWRCSMQSPLRYLIASRLSPTSETLINSLLTRSQLKTRDTLILPIRTFTDCSTRWMFYSCPATMLYTVTSLPTRTFVSRRAISLQPLQFRKMVWFSL